MGLDYESGMGATEVSLYLTEGFDCECGDGGRVLRQVCISLSGWTMSMGREERYCC